MGGFLGIGGKNSQQQNQAIGNLNNLFNFGINQGKASTAAGNQSLGQAGGYFSNLLSGNRPAMLQAVAPETNVAQSQADAARRQQATMGTARGGGTSGANQQQKTDLMSQINNLLFGVRPAAAKETADIGKTQLEAGIQSLSTAGTATAQAGDIATQARQQAGSQFQQVIKDIFGWG